MQRHVIPRQARGFPHGKPRRCQPHFPVHVRQRAGRGAVSGQTRHYGHKAVLLIILCQMPDAVGRIRQTVQQYHPPARLSGRHQHERPVCIRGKVSWPHQALAVITVQRRALCGGDFRRHLSVESGEDGVFPRDIRCEGRVIHLLHRHFISPPGVPVMQGWPLLRKINPHRKQNEHNDPDDHHYFFCESHQAHADPPGQIRHVRLPLFSQSFHLTKKCEEADVFTK